MIHHHAKNYWHHGFCPVKIDSAPAKKWRSQQVRSDTDTQTLVKMNTDAIALLGNAHIKLSHSHKERIKEGIVFFL